MTQKDHPCSVINDLGLAIAGFLHHGLVFLFETSYVLEFAEIMASVFIFSFHYISALQYMKYGNRKGIYSEM